jgi:hypothetical protein
MMRSIPKKLRALAAAFISQYPIYPGYPGQPHTTLDNTDLDAFGQAQGVYDPAAVSVDDFDTERGRLVSSLNSAGSAPSWTAVTEGFQIVVQQRIPGTPTLWIVKPLPVAVSHAAAVMPARNLKTIVNRVDKIERYAAGFNMNALPKEERKALREELNMTARLATLQASIAAAEGASIQKTLNRLARIDPQHRLLPR